MPLTGPEKAVLMLLSLDETSAAPIVSELDEADLRKLREVAAMMRAVPARVQMATRAPSGLNVACEMRFGSDQSCRSRGAWRSMASRRMR